VIDYETLAEATLLVGRIEAAIESTAAGLDEEIAELQKQREILVKPLQGKLKAAKELVERERAEITEAINAADRERYARLGRGEKVPDLEKPQWLTTVRREKLIIEDPKLVPQEYWILDEKKLNKEKKEIPGTRKDVVLGIQVFADRINNKETDQ